MVRAVGAALTLVLLASAPASGATPQRAALKLDSISPLAVSGRAFGADETVLLSYAGVDGTTRTVRVSTTAKGRFRAFFRLRLGRCDSFTVRAAGTNGSRAVLQVERRCGRKAKDPPERAPRLPKKPRSG